MQRILIVDDTSENVKNLEQLLKKLPELDEVISFTNPLKAIEWAQTHTFDVGLIESHMTHMKGLDVIHKLRESGANSGSGLILMMTETEKDMLAAAFEAGMSDYIARPFEPSAFYARVKNLLTIQQQKRDLAHYTYSTLHDNLTGLPNRLLFIERVGQAFLRFKRNPEEKFAVLFVDVDRFKEINDTFGHAAGDKMLKEVAFLLTRCTREVDTVARLGGDEFIILLELTSSEKDVEGYIKRLYDEAKHPIQMSNTARKIELSLGVTLSHERQKNLGDILREADIALYQAKENGRNRAEFYTEKRGGVPSRRLELMSSVTQALSNHEMHVYYQPIVHMRTQKVVGYEALLRWLHPRFGLISLEELVPLVEKNDSIVSLTHFVFEEALDRLVRWQKKLKDPDLTMSINIAVVHALKPNFLESLVKICAQKKVQEKNIILEFSEFTLSELKQKSPGVLIDLVTAGFKMALDDFGDGRMSVGSLVDYPLSILKVDRTLTLNILKDSRKKNLFELMVALGNLRGLTVVVEGIQDRQILECVMKTNASLGQGFYYSQPLLPEEIEGEDAVK